MKEQNISNETDQSSKKFSFQVEEEQGGNLSSPTNFQEENNFMPSPIFNPEFIPFKEENRNFTPNSQINSNDSTFIPESDIKINLIQDGDGNSGRKVYPSMNEFSMEKGNLMNSDNFEDIPVPEIKITLVEDNHTSSSPNPNIMPIQDFQTKNEKPYQPTDIYDKDIATVSVEDMKLNPENKQVDFFHYDFNNEAQTEESQKIEKQPLKEDLLNFDFYNTIRPKEEEEKRIEPEEEKIELSKVLATKDHSEEEKEEEHVLIMPEDKKRKSSRRKNTIRFSIYLFYFFFAIFLLGICLMIIEKKSKFTLVRDDVTLALYSTYQAEVIVDTKIQNNDGYEWSSSNSEVASVDENGLITANSTGSAIITIKSKKTRKKQELSITTIDILINSIRFNQNSITLIEGEETTISPIINEDSNIIVSLNWKSESEDILKVDQNGHIVAFHAGETTVVVQDPKSKLNAKINVIVKEKEVEKPKQSNKNSNKNTNSNKPTNSNTNTNSNSNINPPTIAVQQITLDQTVAKLTKGETFTVIATVAPSNATDKTIIWSSSDTNVATVTNGTITANKEGTAIITATTKDGNKQASITITVENPTIAVTGITLSKTELTLKVGQTKKLTAKITPTDATNKKISWDSKIRKDSIEITETTNDFVKITGKNVGSATITVTSEDGNFKATCKITVQEDSEDN